jgi:hypothetical protein
VSNPAIIEGISAVTLATHNMAPAVRFYRTLGAAERGTEQRRVGHAVGTAGNAAFAVISFAGVFTALHVRP